MTTTELIMQAAVQLLSVGGGAYFGLKGALNGLRVATRETHKIVQEIRDTTRDTQHDLLRITQDAERHTGEIRDDIREQRGLT